MIGDIFQPTHLLFLLVVILLVLGPKRLPEMARSLGRGFRDFRDAISGEDHSALSELHEPIASTAPPEPLATTRVPEQQIATAPEPQPVAAGATMPEPPVATMPPPPAAQEHEPQAAPTPQPQPAVATDPEPVASQASKEPVEGSG